MKKFILITVLALSIFSCTNRWNKESARKTCIEEAKKSLGAYANDSSALKMTEKLCDCSTEKMVSKYKSDAEANADAEGLKKITMDCLKELAPQQKTP